MQRERREVKKRKKNNGIKLKLQLSVGNMRKVLKCETAPILLTKQILNFRNPQNPSPPPTAVHSPASPQISQGWLQNLCKRYAVCHAYAKRESSSYASHSICLTRDLNQLKIDLWIFLVYTAIYCDPGDGVGGRHFKAPAVLLCCVSSANIKNRLKLDMLNSRRARKTAWKL